MSFGGLGIGIQYFWNIAAVNCDFIRKLCVGLAFQLKI